MFALKKSTPSVFNALLWNSRTLTPMANRFFAQNVRAPPQNPDELTKGQNPVRPTGKENPDLGGRVKAPESGSTSVDEGKGKGEDIFSAKRADQSAKENPATKGKESARK